MSLFLKLRPIQNYGKENTMQKRITLSITLCLTLIVLIIPVSASDWTQFQANRENSAFGQGPALKAEPEIAWSQCPGNSGINVPPIVAGNLVYSFTGNGSVYAYNKYSGEAVWTSQAVGSSALQSSTPAYGNGKIFVASNSGDLSALDAKTGEQLWGEHVTDGNFECPVTYSDHRIYVGDGLKGGVSTKYYYCYDENGTLLWKHAHEESAGFLWNGAGVTGSYLVYPTHEGIIISLDRKTGELIDEINLSSDEISFSKEDPGMFRASVSYSDGFVYTTSERGQQQGYVWKIGFDPETGLFTDEGWCTPNGFSTSTPAVYNGKVYVGQGEHGYTGNLTCLDDSTGQILWSYFVDAGIKSSPAIASESGTTYIYFTSARDNGSLYCLTDGGKPAWILNPPDDGYILQGASISDGGIYYGTDAGCLYCIQGNLSGEWEQFHKDTKNTGYSLSKAPDSNNTLWVSEDIGAVSGSSPVIGDGVIYVNCGDYVKSLDLYTGKFLANHTAGSTKYNSITSPSCYEGNVWCGLPDSVNSATTISDGKLFEGGWNGTYYCSDLTTGEVIWNLSVTGNIQGTPACDNGMVYLTSWKYGENKQGHTYCVKADTGEIVWHTETTYSCCGSPAIYGDRVYVTTFNFYGDGELYALDRNNGSVVWTKSIQRTDSTPAVAYGYVYVAGGCSGYSDMQTYCFDADTGDLVWNTTPAQGIGDWLCSVAIADNKVFVGMPYDSGDDYSGYRGICALDAFTGETIWESPYGGSSPAVFNGTVYTISAGRVYAFGDAPDEAEHGQLSGSGFILALSAFLLVGSRMSGRK
jgi:outer membrane protein assembly factor BamB